MLIIIMFNLVGERYAIHLSLSLSLTRAQYCHTHSTQTFKSSFFSVFYHVLMHADGVKQMVSDCRENPWKNSRGN